MATDGDPDLRFHRILVHAEKRLEAQMLHDPFEKELDLPTAFIKLRDDQCRKFKVVGEEAKEFVSSLIVENNATQILRIISSAEKTPVY